jgi:heptaprenyl diphosphate synthase
MTQLHTDKDKKKTNLVAVRGLLVAAAFVLSWLEAQVPVFFAVPGMKLGLTNLVVLMALYKLGWKDALALNFLRIVLTGFTFGNVFSMIYSLAGGMLSCLVMIFLKRSGRFHMVTVSIAGGVFHNVGQILVAMVVLGSTYVFYYLPVLWISGLAAGALIGFLGAQVVRRLPDTLV